MKVKQRDSFISFFFNLASEDNSKFHLRRVGHNKHSSVLLLTVLRKNAHKMLLTFEEYHIWLVIVLKLKQSYPRHRP
jgi:hypothetical protein